MGATMMKWIGGVTLLGILSGCALQTPVAERNVVESVISLDHSSELRFSEYEYSNAEQKACVADRSACYLNGYPALGVNNVPPASYLSGLTLNVADRQYDLETTHMYNPMTNRKQGEGDNMQYFVVVCVDAINCTVRGIFADAGASYVAEWLIVDGVSLRTILSPSADVVEAFVDNIVPPDFE